MHPSRQHLVGRERRRSSPRFRYMGMNRQALFFRQNFLRHFLKRFFKPFSGAIFQVQGLSGNFSGFARGPESKKGRRENLSFGWIDPICHPRNQFSFRSYSAFFQDFVASFLLVQRKFFYTDFFSYSKAF